jgi:hypothetical protein
MQSGTCGFQKLAFNILEFKCTQGQVKLSVEKCYNSRLRPLRPRIRIRLYEHLDTCGSTVTGTFWKLLCKTDEI